MMVQEITTITKTTSTTIITTTTEITVKEIFESIIVRTTVTSETMSVCRSLIALYMSQERWIETIKVIERSLAIMWKMVISGHGTIALPSQFDSEAIEFAVHLAICHYRAHHYHEAEELYVRIYRACRISCHVEDLRLERTYLALVTFYQEHKQWQRLIEIHKEMVEQYRRHLGPSHRLTIKTLYILGSLCLEHGHGHAHEYYKEIVTVLNGSSTVCHHDAVEAMTILCRIYYEEGHWEALRQICRVLWETWTQHHQKYKFDAEFIEVFYARYVYVLEHHVHCEYEVLRKIHIQFRDTCVKVFGMQSFITIKAMIELAHICARRDEHIHEAVKIYEEVSYQDLGCWARLTFRRSSPRPKRQQ